MSEPPPGPAENVRRWAVLAVLEVAKYRRTSALAWVVTWAIFLGLVAATFSYTDFGALGCLNCQGTEAIDLLIPILAFSFFVPGGVSILFGALSSMKWGETFRDLISTPGSLALAWLRGIRSSKQAWNTGRMFLWGSWILGAFIGTAFLFADDLIDDSTASGSNVAGLYEGLIILLLLVFLALRSLHHYFFARSVASAAEELCPALPRDYWRNNELWWSIGTFTLPFDPVVLFIVALFACEATNTTGNGEYGIVVGAVLIGGTLALGAGALVTFGYHQLVTSIQHWMRSPAEQSGPAGSSIPPEWAG